MKAMIFAAGLGKRLGEITRKIPKALVEISGKTILKIAVEKLSNQGFNDIIVNIHHFADRVEEEITKIKKEGYELNISDERDLLLETGGGLYKARWFFDETPFLLYNVDIITDLDLAALYRFHQGEKCLASLAVQSRADNRLFLVDKHGLIHGWCNKTTGEEIIAGIKDDKLSEVAFSGVHVVNPEIFNYMDEGVYSLTTLYLQLAADHNICTYRHDKNYWTDIGTVEDLENVRKYYS